MGQDIHIHPSPSEVDQESAQRALETFVTVYQVTLIRVEEYLEEIIIEVGPELSGGYKPWLSSVRDLARGAFLLSQKTQLHQKERFIDALRVFSFGGAVQFLNDVCMTIGMDNDRKWAENFKEHIHTLMLATQKMQAQNEQPTAH